MVRQYVLNPASHRAEQRYDIFLIINTFFYHFVMLRIQIPSDQRLHFSANYWVIVIIPD